MFNQIKLYKDVEVFPYRTAVPRDRFLNMPRDDVSSLEKVLARAAGVRMGNHVVYGITTQEGNKIYVMFHDLVAIFGLSVEVRNW